MNADKLLMGILFLYLIGLGTGIAVGYSVWRW
jgi:hypothetical protein